jgi:type IV pilus assembly protein PilV
LKLLSKSTGFTLIEVLIAIVILSISLLALAALMATTTRNTSFGGHMTEAATFAQDRLERLKAISWDNIVTDPVPNTIPGASGITYTRNLNVVQNGDLKTATITVSWTDPTNIVAPHSFNIICVFLKPT